MKRILLAIIFLTGCKKNITLPKQNALIKDERLFNYHVSGYYSNNDLHTAIYTDKYGNSISFSATLLDSCEVMVNNILKYKESRAYHIPLKKGDVLSVRMRGKVSNKSANYFLFWEDKNEPIKLDTLYAENGFISGSIVIK